jgi:hypothetical protein
MNRGRTLLSLLGGLTLLLNGMLSAPARAEVTENIKIPSKKAPLVRRGGDRLL